MISYRLSTNQIDLGESRYCEYFNREFYVENTGKVTFEYKVLLHAVKKKGFIECAPSIGRILGGEKIKIVIRVCPVMP